MGRAAFPRSRPQALYEETEASPARFPQHLKMGRQGRRIALAVVSSCGPPQRTDRFATGLVEEARLPSIVARGISHR